jgi:hypothetical protein
MELRAGFPFAGIEEVTATIVDVAPQLPLAERRRGQAEDLALLTVATDLGFAICPQSISTVPARSAARFVCWGFPETAAGGTPAFGEVGDMDSSGLFHIQRTQAVEPFVEEGFSGCPIFERLISDGTESYGNTLGICVLRTYGEAAVGRFIGAEEILRWLRPRLSPYPGNTPFSAAHAPLYCGHSAFVADLQEQAYEQGLVALIGPSKTGRTSLIQAGLTQVEDPKFGLIGLASGTEQLLHGCGRALGVDWRHGNAGRILRELDQLTRERRGVLLIIDRVEDLAAPELLDRSRDLLQLLAGAAQARQHGPERFALILIVEESKRSALDLLLRDGIPPESECAMPALGYQEIRSAIVRPAEQFGVRFAPNLVRRIINEFNWDHVTLPELASSLKRMWRAKGAQDYIGERAFPGFGIERALATGEGEDVAAHEEELAKLRSFLEEREKRPAEGLEQLSHEPVARDSVIELRELAEACEPQLMSPRRSEARLALERRRSDLWAALNACTADPALADEGLRLAAALFWYWNLEADFVSGRDMLERLIDLQPADAPSMPLAKGCYASGTLAFLSGEMDAARSRLTQAVCLFCALHEAGLPDAERWMAYALVVLGRTDDRLPRAQRREGIAVDIMGKLNDGWGLALALNDLGFVTAASGKFREASDLYGRSISLWRARKDLWGLPMALVNYGAWAIEASDFVLATEALRQARQIHEAVGDRWEIPNSIRFTAELALRRGRSAKALAGYRESLVAARSIGRVQLVVDSLLGIARALVATKPGDRETAMRAAELLGGFEAAVARNRYPVTWAQELASEKLAADLLGTLGEEDYATEARRGGRREWIHLVDSALRD